MANMIALKSFSYGGRNLRKGDSLTVKFKHDVKTLTAIGCAVLHVEPKPAPEPLRRTYRTRVLTPEPVVVEPEPVAPVDEAEEAQDSNTVEISPRTGLPKRQYRRRDMESTE